MYGNKKLLTKPGAIHHGQLLPISAERWQKVLQVTEHRESFTEERMLK